MDLEGWSKFVIANWGVYSPACNFIDQMVLKFGAKHVPEMDAGDFLAVVLAIQIQGEIDQAQFESSFVEDQELYPGEPRNRVDKWQ